jgi:hypothetical protein
MGLDQLSDDELASRLAAEIGLSRETALRAIRSEDPDLGRAYAIRLLAARDRHREQQQEITTHRRNLRSAF